MDGVAYDALFILFRNNLKPRKNMELLVKTLFWTALFCCALRLVMMATRDYPVKETATLGTDLVRLIENAVFAVWAGIIIFG